MKRAVTFHVGCGSGGEHQVRRPQCSISGERCTCACGNGRGVPLRRPALQEPTHSTKRKFYVLWFQHGQARAHALATSFIWSAAIDSSQRGSFGQAQSWPPLRSAVPRGARARRQHANRASVRDGSELLLAAAALLSLVFLRSCRDWHKVQNDGRLGCLCVRQSEAVHFGAKTNAVLRRSRRR